MRQIMSLLAAAPTLLLAPSMALAVPPLEERGGWRAGTSPA
jgi:hypothetical protein